MGKRWNFELIDRDNNIFVNALLFSLISTNNCGLFSYVFEQRRSRSTLSNVELRLGDVIMPSLWI